MKEDKSHNNKTGFTTPKDYFLSFEANLLDKLNLKDHQDLAGEEKTGFNLPKDYFNSFENDLFTKLNIKTNTELTNRDTGFSTPEGYLDSLDDRIFKTVVPQEETKVITLFTRKQLMRIASIAAVFVLGFFITKSMLPTIEESGISFEDIEYAAFEEYLNEEDLTLSEYEIADLYNATEDDIDNISTESAIDNNLLYEYLSDEYTTDDYIDSL